MNNFLRGGRELSNRQGDHVIKLTSYQYLSSCPKEEKIKYLLSNCRKIGTQRSDVACGWGLLSANSHLLLAFTITFYVLFSAAAVIPAFGQEADGLKTIRALSIGDKIPNELWDLRLQVINDPGGKDRVALSDYRGKKLIILDFWATWCAPCIRSLSKLDTLQMEFKENVQILPITYEDKSKILPLFRRNNWSLATVILDTVLRGYFPHKTIPHHVWIYEGKVMAVTSASNTNQTTISKMLDGHRSAIKSKKELDVDVFKPITSVIPDSQNVLLQSYILGYVDGIGNTGDMENEETKVVYLFNRPILSMFRTILKVPYSHILLNVADSSRFLYKKDDYSNIYTYQLIASKPYEDSLITARCISDLANFFNVKLDRRQVYIQGYSLQPLSRDLIELTKEEAGAGAMDIKQLIASLEYTKNWSPHPVRFSIDFSYNGYFRKSILQYKNITDLKTKLAEYGLTLDYRKQPLNFYIISES